MLSRISSGVHRHMSQAKAAGVNLSGIFPPIATPFNADETIAYDKLKDNFKIWGKIPFAGYLVQGSNGEYPMLSSHERVELVSKVRQMIPKDKLLIAGSSAQGTRITIELTNQMAAAGANAVLVTTPGYFKNLMDDTALYEHFTRLATQSAVPVILYNMPGFTGIDMSAPLVVRLAEHPNIIGIKESAGDIAKMSRIIKKTRHLGFQVMVGSAGYLLPGLHIGCVGGMLGLANILGADVCRLYELFSSGHMTEATELHLQLVTANALVTREMGVPAIKAALDMVGMYGGPCRQPLQPLTPAQALTLREGFADLI